MSTVVVAPPPDLTLRRVEFPSVCPHRSCRRKGGCPHFLGVAPTAEGAALLAGGVRAWCVAQAHERGTITRWWVFADPRRA